MNLIENMMNFCWDERHKKTVKFEFDYYGRKVYGYVGLMPHMNFLLAALNPDDIQSFIGFNGEQLQAANEQLKEDMAFQEAMQVFRDELTPEELEDK
ncbi:hypothetical protein COL23_25770 [Priestia aryabhattai]|uniref:hypothetical protein n=1 Tax=Priestia aryabhattai TaxID=412384 RepID=UPI000BF383B9|nr:hypothetical protein [Priestia aryabhattai]PFW72162.1 hypothetical protein COL23_25770 [Priestia aryabhattai]